MTTPFERTRALVKTKELLQRLENPELTPDAPDWLRSEATALLRHYPSLAQIDLAHKALPLIYGPAPPFSRLAGTVTVRSVIDGSKRST